jgi:hypothetical protein
MDPKPKDNHFAVIDIKNNSASTAEKYFCSYCNTRLTPYTQEDMKGAYICIKCTIDYWPNQTPTKKADKFDLPGPATDSSGNIIGDKNIPIAILDTPEASSTSYKQPKLTAAYEALSRHGYKFTSYEEK